MNVLTHALPQPAGNDEPSRLLAGVAVGLLAAGIGVVLISLVLVSGVDAAGFGIVLRKHRLDPLLTTAVISLSALLT